MGGPTYGIGSHAMNGGSSGKTVVIMEDSNNEMWDRLFTLPDMDPDRSAEWSEGPSALVEGTGSKRQRTDTGDSDDVGDGEDADVCVISNTTTTESLGPQSAQTTKGWLGAGQHQEAQPCTTNVVTMKY